MRSVTLLFFVCSVAVSASAFSFRDEENLEPTREVPGECREQVNPLLNTLHTSLHDQRHQVHVQCRERLRTEREHHRQEKDNLFRSRDHCRKIAKSLPRPQDSVELISQCDYTVKHLLRDRAYVQAITRIHESCRHLVEEVTVRVHDSTVRLLEVLTTCSRPHACFIYRVVKNSILANVDQIHSDASGDVQRICRRPGLIHHLRRACERFNLTSSILIDVETILPRVLHRRLSEDCAVPFSPLHGERMPEVPEEIVATTEPRTRERTEPPEATAEHHEPTRDGLPGWDGEILGVGPVIMEEETTEPMEVTTEPVEVTTEPVKVTTEPVEVTTEPVEVTTEPVEVTTEPVEVTTEPVEVTTEPVEVTTEPVEVTTEPTEEERQVQGTEQAEANDDKASNAGAESQRTSRNKNTGPGENMEEKDTPNQSDPERSQPHPHHHSHRSLTIGMIAAVGVLCVIVTILSASLTMMILRRRSHVYRQNAADREVKVPLTDDDQLATLKNKGYENPTYAFFEGTEE